MVTGTVGLTEVDGFEDGRQLPYPSGQNPDGQVSGIFVGALTVSHTHVPSVLYFPVGHPDEGGTGIVIDFGVVTVGTDGVDGDGEESQQQHPQQLSSPHAASAQALALAWALTYKSIGSIAAHSTLSLIWIILLFLFFCKFFQAFLTATLALSESLALVPTN